jgi:hypothetical protein
MPAPLHHRPVVPAWDGSARAGRGKRDGTLGAGHHTEAASSAGITSGCVGRLAPVCHDAQLGQGAQGGKVAVIDRSHFEHVVGTDDDAVTFRFAAAVIDDRHEGPGLSVAPLTRTIRMLGRSPFFEEIRFRLSHVSGYRRPRPRQVPGRGASRPSGCARRRRRQTIRAIRESPWAAHLDAVHQRPAIPAPAWGWPPG